MISTRLLRQFFLWTITFSSITSIGKLKLFWNGFSPMARGKCNFLRRESQTSEYLLQFLLNGNKSWEFTQSAVQWINICWNFFHYLTTSWSLFVTDLIMGIPFGHYVPSTSSIHLKYRQYCVCNRETAAQCDPNGFTIHYSAKPFVYLSNVCHRHFLKRRTVDVCGRFLSPHRQRGCLSDTGSCLHF